MTSPAPESHPVRRLLATDEWRRRLVFWGGAVGAGAVTVLFAGLGGELHRLVPIAPLGAIVVLSMAAYFAGVVQAPLTALVIVLEMTNDRSLLLPLMAAALLGRAASALICHEPLYQSLARRYLPAAAAEPKAGATDQV